MFVPMLATAALLMGASPAYAEAPATDEGDTTRPTLEEPEFDLPAIELDQIPPRYSYELGIQVSFGEITYWRGSVPPWVGLGVRVGWGWHVPNNHRIGGSVAMGIEGPAPVHYTAAFEPAVTWDWAPGGLTLGASVGPSMFLHGTQATLRDRGTVVKFGPTVSFRAGFSQAWNLLGRRFYIVAEPRFRLMGERINAMGTLVVGSGRGF